MILKYFKLKMTLIINMIIKNEMTAIMIQFIKLTKMLMITTIKSCLKKIFSACHLNH